MLCDTHQALSFSRGELLKLVHRPTPRINQQD